MKQLLLCALLGIGLYSDAQLTTAPSGGNKKAIIGEQIGLTKVIINYDRPAVKGREGKTWRQLKLALPLAPNGLVKFRWKEQ